LRVEIRGGLEARLPPELEPLLSKRIVRVTPAALLIEIPNRELRIVWKTYEGVCGGERLCVLFAAQDQYTLLPSRAFASEEEYVDFVRRAAGQVRKARGGA
jgi:hypothetical protein